MTDISRRAAMSLILLAPVAVVAACAPEDAPDPGPASPSVASGGDPGAVAPAAASTPPQIPDAGDLFGPTGQHWPTRTPRPYDAFDASVECECSWEAIAEAIAAVDAAAPDGAARVLVRPGTLPGNGAGSTSEAVLEGIGREGRASRVLVIPRDGVGSVTLDGSIRIDAVIGVAFAGFWSFPKSVVLTSTRDFAWAWAKGQAFNITSGASGPSDDVELVECVTPEASSGDADTWAFRTADNPYRNISVRGCYLAPTYKPDDSSAHCDTLQLSGNSDKEGLLIEDTVLFASTNAGFIPSAGATGVVFDHSLLVGGDRMLERYPLPDGANAFTSGPPAAVNAGGSVDQMSAKDSIFIGGVRGTFLEVENSRSSAEKPPQATGGSFTSDPSLSDIDAGWLEANAPMPTDDRLKQIWVLR